jgi:hypothetical protein
VYIPGEGAWVREITKQRIRNLTKVGSYWKTVITDNDGISNSVTVFYE